MTKADQVRNARVLSVDETRKLIQAARKAGDYRGVPGPERALIYITACETGLRANELRLLELRDFDFDGSKLTVRPEVSKKSKEPVLPLKPSTSEMICQHSKYKMLSSMVFSVPAQPHLMIKSDLKAAGIEYTTEDGTAYFQSPPHLLNRTVSNLSQRQDAPEPYAALGSPVDLECLHPRRTGTRAGSD